MGDFRAAFFTALGLLVSLDADLVAIVRLSLTVSLSAVGLATVLGLPLGAAVAVWRFPGQAMVRILLNALMGLPPVVVGLVVYLLLSRAGPLGPLGLLFTPTAMVIAQCLLLHRSLRRSHGRQWLIYTRNMPSSSARSGLEHGTHSGRYCGMGALACSRVFWPALAVPAPK